MTIRRPVSPLLVTLLLVLAAPTVVAHAGDLSDPGLLRITASPSLAASATRLRKLDSSHIDRIADLIGLEETGAPIEIYLLPENSPQAQLVPGWITGFANSEVSQIVLLPQRLPSYPDSSLDDLFRHEIAHIFIARAARHRQVPRWFNAGLAVVAGSPWGLDDRSRLAVSILRGGRKSMSELDAEFAHERGDIRRAYALSAALVRDLLRRYGTDAGARILRNISQDLTFDASFEEATGIALSAFEASFWRRHTFWYRWVPILTSSITLWVGVTVLALAAGVRRRRRNAEQYRVWEEEERLAALADLSSVPDEDPGPN